MKRQEFAVFSFLLTSWHRLLLPAVLAAMTVPAAAQLKAPGTAPRSSGIFVPQASDVATPSSQPKLGVPQAGGQKRSQLVDEVVAVVNNSVITRRELLDRADEIEGQLRAAGRPVPARADLLGEVLERLVMERVQTQAAQEAGIRVTDQEIDRAIESVAQQNRLNATELRRRVEASGMTWTKYREELRKQVQVIRLREREVDSKVQVYDGEIDNYLAARGGQGAASGPTEYNVAQILVRVPENASDAQKQAQRAKAEGLLKQAQGGADFAQLAQANSEGPEAAQGGAMGFREIGRLPALFANAVVDLQAGGVAPQVVESAAGFHVVKLVAKRAAPASSPAAASKITQTQVRHILIRTGPNMPEAEARRQLSTLRDRITHGGDFADAAKRFSQDGSAQNGGDLGWVSPGELVPEFEQAMSRLRPNEISEPVVTQFGVHLIQVLNRRETEMSPEKQRDFARAEVREQKLRAAYDDWVRQLRSQAYVEYRVNRQR
ncbi:Peptidyl-prolyl isomerase, parvulin family [Cupriavidus necator]|uniref:Chaperone SurA n=1 Tax=Cupriavidus necator (strain ATCC 17699 / DSM 428 / KCTC 22496 / NCIMB 10442 / H16 / Stanier 337) TaxID=381666 RepID=Q0KEA9_CUPNH|nr:peptidylprolyl isomerase [Cupriavidus necator]QCB99601.1 molecular chaperone SurA [Cupriavidus necator H16]QQB77582.1 peptidylprolyl isomerase [Cupriavidus necator]WKA41435.1 peptidylprolyl isomerase [Cupriavidus necator]CAJ91662.1 Peptidyl-prolyl cis-trans isomerase (rotamase c)protein [Cupriavidus necator H16]